MKQTQQTCKLTLCGSALILLAALCLFALPGVAGAEEMPRDLSGRALSLDDASDRQIRAAARNQLDVLEAMLNLYYLQNREEGFPEDFGDLTTSPAWTIEIFNLYTGEPVTGFQEPLDQGNSAVRPDFAPDSGGGGASGSGSGFTAIAPGRIPEIPGDVFYMTDGSTSYQIGMRWGEDSNGQAVQRNSSRPYNFYAARQLPLRPSRPADRSLLLVAQFLEKLLPQLERRYRHFFESPTAAERDEDDQRSFSELMDAAALLGFQPYNPFNDELLSTSDSYQPGTVYTGELTSHRPDELFYCFSDGRIRSLGELVDRVVRQRRSEEIASRDRAVAGPPPGEADEETSEEPEEEAEDPSDKPWRR